MKYENTKLKVSLFPVYHVVKVTAGKQEILKK